jgi:AcrR family transcriptional regulator
MARKARALAAAAAAPPVEEPASGDGGAYDAVEKRNAIRRAAYRCFTERGYHLTTVDDICKVNGISKGAFYWHYASKLAVFHSILDAWSAEVETELARQFLSALAMADAFKALTAAFESEIQRTRRIAPVWLEFLAQAQRDPEIRAGLAQFHERITRAIAKLFAQVSHGALAGEQGRTVASVVMASFIGLMCDALVTGDVRATNRQLRKAMTLTEALVTDAMRVRSASRSARRTVGKGGRARR